MPKKTLWFCFIKKFFYQDTQELKVKRRRWLFGRLKKTPKSLALPEQVRQSKMLVIKEVHMGDSEVREPVVEHDTEVAECTNLLNANVPTSNVEHEAATKIQTVYRGHLARKALRALKGFVSLQAIIRGRAVRRQAVTTLRCLQSVVSIQSEICARRRQLSKEMCISDSMLQQDFRTEKPKMRLRRELRSDCGLPTKDDESDFISRKKEAILRRQRIKAYSFNHRESTDSEDGHSESSRLKFWLKQYVDSQPHPRDDKSGNLPIFGPRRSLQNPKKQSSYIEQHGSRPSSPINLPTYMMTTKSAKAKTRSVSSPRPRPMHFEAYSDGDSPYKHKFSPMSSINSEVTGSSFSKSLYSSSHQKSPRLNGASCPVRSNRIVNDICLDSANTCVVMKTVSRNGTTLKSIRDGSISSK